VPRAASGEIVSYMILARRQVVLHQVGETTVCRVTLTTEVVFI